MILIINFHTKNKGLRDSYWTRRYWRVWLVFWIIPIVVDNYKTEYIYPNGDPYEKK